MNLLSIKKKTAFTLAEVLITLGIIGVVAALTLPTLIQNHQKQVMLTQLKKAYSVLNQAFKLSEIENGEYEYWELPSGGAEERHAFAEKYWVPFLNSAKYCSNYTECGYKEEYPWSNLNGSRKNDYGISENGANYILPDGTYLRFSSGGVLIDLNSSKNPNIYCKDVFVFDYDKIGIKASCLSMNTQQILERCSSSTKDGACCSARIINLDGWQIADDYPW